jgi:hypothetical protein
LSTDFFVNPAQAAEAQLIRGLFHWEGLSMPPEPAPAYQMDFFERCFIVLAVVGSLGVIAVVTWMKVCIE